MKTKAISTLKGGVLKWRPMVLRVWSMNFNQYTKKSLEAVQSAQGVWLWNIIISKWSSYCFWPLLQQEEGGLAPQILRKLGVTVEGVWKLRPRRGLTSFPGFRQPGGGQILYNSGGRRCAPAGQASGGQHEGRIRVCGAFAPGPGGGGPGAGEGVAGDLSHFQGGLSPGPFRPSGATSGSPLTARRIPMRPWKVRHGPGAPGQGEKDGPGHWPG